MKAEYTFQQELPDLTLHALAAFDQRGLLQGV